MPGSGTRTFLDPDHYEASLRQAHIELLITYHGQLKARLTSAELHYLQVLRCDEDFPRVGFLRFRPGLAFVTFPLQSANSPVWCGAELGLNQLILASRGEQLHQLAAGPCGWGVIILDRVRLEHYGRALSGKPFACPPEAKILLPSARDAARLRRLHAQVCRLAETKPRTLSYSEVAHAIEQGLIHALVSCLIAARVRVGSFTHNRHARIMIMLEEVLSEHLGDPLLRIPRLCELIGVRPTTLRSCCAEFLGMSPTRYILLRRLRAVRSALREADPDTVKVAEIACRFGFAKVGGFVTAYRAAFSEAPQTTLQCAPRLRFVTP